MESHLGPDDVAGGTVDRRDALRASAAVALGISTMALPTAAQAFSLTLNGAPVSGVSVYWAQRGTVGSQNGYIARLTYSGDGRISNVEGSWVTGLEAPQRMTTDGTSLYYTTATTAVADTQGIWRVDIGGTATRVIPGAVGFTRPFVDAEHIYYTSSSSDVLRIAKDGSGSSTLLFDGDADYRDIEVVGDTVYVADWTNSRVITFPKAGTVSSPVVFASVLRANAIDVADGVVYVGSSDDRTVYRFGLDGTPIGQFGTGGYVDRIQVVDGAVFVASTNSTTIRASGLDGVNSDPFAQLGNPIQGTNLHGMAVLP
jgi:hypothetical protein